MDGSIGKKEQNLVLVHALGRIHIVQELLEKRGEQGRSSKADLRECLPVSIDDALDADDLWILGVSIHGKAVTDSVDAKMAWNTAKSEYWEAPVIVVGLNDNSNVHESGFILVIASHVVK